MDSPEDHYLIGAKNIAVKMTWFLLVAKNIAF